MPYINPGVSRNQDLCQNKCFINSIISWFDDRVRNHTSLADDPNVCKQVTNSSCGQIQGVEIADGLLITLHYRIWCIILTLENFRWVPKEASEELQRESMEIWRSWILYPESTLSESTPEWVCSLCRMDDVLDRNCVFHPSLWLTMVVSYITPTIHLPCSHQVAYLHFTYLHSYHLGSLPTYIVTTCVPYLPTYDTYLSTNFW